MSPERIRIRRRREGWSSDFAAFILDQFGNETDRLVITWPTREAARRHARSLFPSAKLV